MTQHAEASHPTVRLILIPEMALEALLTGDLERAGQQTGVALPPAFLEQGWLWRYRLDQVRADPASAPWLVRATYALPEAAVVGHAGFHGPPDDRGMVEIGYSTLPEYRRRGYARAATEALLAYAAAVPAVRVVRASVSPENVASLALIHALGFTPVGEQWDEEDGRELVFERPPR